MIFEGTDPNYRVSSDKRYLVIRHALSGGEFTYELRQYAVAVTGLKKSSEAVEWAKNLESERIRACQAAAAQGRVGVSTAAPPDPPSEPTPG